MALRRLLLFLSILAFFQLGISDLHGQVAVNPIKVVPTDPTGACPPARVELSASSGNFFFCDPMTMTWANLGSGGGITQAYQTIQDESSPLTQRSTLNFSGTGVSCSDANPVTTCAIPGIPTGFYTQSFTGQTSVSLTHNLGTKILITQCFDNSDIWVEPNTLTNGTNTSTVTFTNAQTGYCNVNSQTGGTSAGVTKISGTATINFSSAINDLGCAVGGTTITVSGANVGDPVMVAPSTNLASKVEAFGKVTASNTVTVEACNYSGVAVTPGSATWTAQIFH